VDILSYYFYMCDMIPARSTGASPSPRHANCSSRLGQRAARPASCHRATDPALDSAAAYDPVHTLPPEGQRWWRAYLQAVESAEAVPTGPDAELARELSLLPR
jgi:hypothetical protein